MLDHVSLSVTDPARSQAFYVQALAPLGYKVISQYEGGFGIGAEGGSAIWVAAGPAQKPIAHLAFRAQDRKLVDAFYRAALAAGGRDNGKPGLRENYSPTYYAAFVLDPDGNNVEAVCHAAGWGSLAVKVFLCCNGIPGCDESLLGPEQRKRFIANRPPAP